MNKDKVLDPSDAPNERLRDELREIVWSDEGLYFVSRNLVGNTRLLEKIHKPKLVWAWKHIRTPDALVADRDPRMSGKTDGLSQALPFACWATPPLVGSPVQGINTTLAYVMPKKDLASYIQLVGINERWEKMRLYFELFPWVKKSKYWSLKHGFRLERDDPGGLPNVLPLGMESISTSIHPLILVCDDPIHEQNYRSRVLVAQVKDWVKHSHALTAVSHGSRVFIGNYWAVGDVQSDFQPQQEDAAAAYRRVHVWERGITGCETCVAGETTTCVGGGSISGRIPGHEHTGPTVAVALAREPGASLDDPEHPGIDDGPAEPADEFITSVRESKDSATFLTQHENILVDPRTLKFKQEHLKFWEWDATGAEMAIRVMVPLSVAATARAQGQTERFSIGKSQTTERLTFDDLDFYVLVDPAPSEQESAGHSQFSAAAYAVEKAGPREFLIEEYADNKPEHEHLDLLLDWYTKYRPWFRRFGIESVGYQAVLKDALLTAARGRGMWTVRETDFEMLTRLRSEGQQIDRINYVFAPKLEKGLLHVHPSHRIFLKQHGQFGVPGAKHDLLDAISNIDRTAKKQHRGGGGKALAAVEEARRRQSQVDSTGYGS